MEQIATWQNGKTIKVTFLSFRKMSATPLKIHIDNSFRFTSVCCLNSLL